MEKLRIRDSLYPKQLHHIAQAPEKLYVLGNTELLSRESIAIVGSRKPTPYGTRATQEITTEIAEAGIPIVSGMAMGIDALAHTTALNANAPTIAVLGCGLDDKSIYPQANLGIAREILQAGGTLISEYPPGTKAKPYHFPHRNRIIAGLAEATIVMEAGQKSGSKITAHKAMEQGKGIFAVPGSIFSPLSRGTNQLIDEGATPAMSGQEILEKLSLDYRKTNTAEQEELLLIKNSLNKDPKTFYQLAETTQFPTPKLLHLLTRLELAGQIRKLSGQLYIKNEESRHR